MSKLFETPYLLKLFDIGYKSLLEKSLKSDRSFIPAWYQIISGSINESRWLCGTWVDRFSALSVLGAACF